MVFDVRNDATAIKSLYFRERKFFLVFRIFEDSRGGCTFAGFLHDLVSAVSKASDSDSSSKQRKELIIFVKFRKLLHNYYKSLIRRIKSLLKGFLVAL